MSVRNSPIDPITICVNSTIRITRIVIMTRMIVEVIQKFDLYTWLALISSLPFLKAPSFHMSILQSYRD